MREPCIRDLQVSGIVGHGDQFAVLAAGLATGELRVSCRRGRETSNFESRCARPPAPAL
jgi:hypothetical protein